MCARSVDMKSLAVQYRALYIFPCRGKFFAAGGNYCGVSRGDALAMCGIIVGGVPAIPAFMAARLKIVETAIDVAITMIVVMPGKFALYNASVRSKMAVCGPR